MKQQINIEVKSAQVIERYMNQELSYQAAFDILSLELPSSEAYAMLNAAFESECEIHRVNPGGI